MALHRRHDTLGTATWGDGGWEAGFPPPRRESLGLPALIVALAVVGGALWWLGGPPSLPSARPDFGALRQIPDFLRGSPGLAEFRPALPWVLAGAWLVWSWLVLSVLLQLGIAALEVLTRGARWIRGLRCLVDATTATVARRVVTGGVAGYLLVRLVASTTPAAHAAPLPEHAQTLLVADPADPHAAGAIPLNRDKATASTIDYIIQPGDSLWRIAERFYGDGDQYPRLLAANQGRLQSNGEPFRGILQPGEVLLVPIEGATATAGERTHVVRPGETLRGIAAAELGDEGRWPELLIDGVPVREALADPDLIHVGLVVAVPVAEDAPPGTGPEEAPPLALPDGAIEARGGEPVAVAVTAAPDGTPLTAIAVTQGAHGTVHLGTGGEIVYTPARDYAGPDTFTFTASDPLGRTATATIRVTVTSAAPVPLPARLAVSGAATGARASGSLAVPVPAPAAPVPPAATRVPAPTPAPASPVPAPAASPADPVAPALGAGLAGLALVAGGAALLRHRRRNAVGIREFVRRMGRAPKPAWQLDPEDYPADFASADLAHTFQHRLAGGEPEPAVALAAHAAALLRERGLGDSAVLLATHERRHAVVTVRTTAAERQRVLALAADLGARLGCAGRGERQGSDVELRLAGPTARGLLAPHAGPEPTMIALAALPSGARLFANYDALGHVLVAGAPGEGVDTVLTSLIAGLAARRAPGELRLHAVAARRALPGDLFALPHWDGDRVDPSDTAAVSDLLARLRRELNARRRDAGTPDDPTDVPAERPELVLVIGELGGIAEGGLTTLAQIAQDGPAHGIRILAATTRPEHVRDDLLASFATRAVLRLADDAQSVRLLGSPDATALGGGGSLLLRLAGAPPRPCAGVEAAALRGLRLDAEELAALVQGMVAHYGPIAEPEEGNDPAGEVAAEVVDMSGGEIAAPDTVADEYDYHADVAHLTFEDEATEGEDGLSNHAGGVEEGQVATSTPMADESADDAPPARPATGTGGADSWWERSDEFPESIAAAPAASTAPCASWYRAEGATAMEANTSAEVNVENCCTPDDHDSSPESRDSRPSTKFHILEIVCFGPQLQLRYDGRRIALSSPKATELLAFLAVQPPGPIDREMVLNQIWPDKPDDEVDGDGWGDDTAKGKRLRTTIWRLKRDLTQEGVNLPASLVRIERDGTIVFDATIARSDVQRFFVLCDRATNRQNPPPLAGDDGVVSACREAYALLTSHGPGERRLLGATGYGWLDEHWRGVKIEDRLRSRLRHASERTIERCLAEGEHEAALGLLQPLFEEDYTDEVMARQLLMVYGHLGDRASVLYVDRMVRQALKRTLFEGLTARERSALSEEAYAPARETRLLVARLLTELSDEAKPSAGDAVRDDNQTSSRIGGQAVD